MESKKIVFCLPGREFSGNFLVSWTNLMQHCLYKGYKMYLSQRFTSNIYFVRSMCLGADVRRGENQKPFDEKLDYSHIFWIDSDIIFTPDQFEKLLNHDVDICSGLYYMEGRTQFATVEKWDTEYFNKYGSFEFITPEYLSTKNNSLIEVSYSGMGFMLIKKGVFENIKYPWFFDEIQRIGNCVDIPSEDVSFCKKATNAGFKIYIDPTVIVGHQKMVTL